MPSTFCRAAAGLAAVLVLLSLPAAAEEKEAGHASGKFKSGDTSFSAGDAYAFRAKSLWEDGQAILVAVSNAGFNASFIDPYWDRKHLVNLVFKNDDDTALVWFEFGLDGKYRGISYYFGPGNGCGWCGGGDVKSTVKKVGERLVGAVSTADKERSFDLALDVPIASDDHGKLQGEGGGEPGKVYLAFHQALVARDVPALKKIFAQKHLERWSEAEQKGQSDAFLASWAEDHPEKVKVTKAFVRDERALVLVAGEAAGAEKVHGEILLAREGGSWRLLDETIQPGSE